MTAPIAIGRALADARLLGAVIGDLGTWSTWLRFSRLRSAIGSTIGNALFDTVAGGREPPRKVKELVAIASRRSGKGRMGLLVRSTRPP